MTNSNENADEPKETPVPRELDAGKNYEGNNKEIGPFLKGSCSSSGSATTNMEDYLSDSTRSAEKILTDESTAHHQKIIVEAVIHTETISGPPSNNHNVDVPKIKTKIAAVEGLSYCSESTFDAIVYNNINDIKSIAANVKEPVKRKLDAIDHIDTINPSTSNNNNIDVPQKKPKIISVTNFPPGSQSTPYSPSCNQSSPHTLKLPVQKWSPHENNQTKNIGKITLRKIGGKSSSADSYTLVKTSSELEKKSILCGITTLNISTNRLNITETHLSNNEKPSSNDEKPFVKSESNFRERSFCSDELKYIKSERDLSKELKFLLHIINLKKGNNQKFTGCLKINGPLNAFGEIYCFKKQVDCGHHYVLNEIKMFHENSFVCYKELKSAEFNLQKYFKIFMHLSEKFGDQIISEFKIYCNRDLDKGSLQKSGVRVKEPNPELNLYKFKIGKEHEMYNKFSECSVIRNLAKTIIKCINERKPATIRYKLLKKYHVALIKENVLVIKDGIKDLTAKFHGKFIKNDDSLSHAAKELRKQIIKNLNTRLTHKTSFKVYKNFGDTEENSIVNLPDEKFDDLFDAFFKVFQIEFTDEDIDNDMKKSLPNNFIHITDDMDLKALNEEIYSFLERTIDVKDDLFESLNNTISKCTIKKKLLEGIEPKENIELEQQNLTEFEQWLNNFQYKRIILFLTDYKLLSTLKVKQFTNRYTNDVEQSIFISANTFLESTDDVVRSLVCSSTQFLTIQWDRDSDKNQAQAALKKLEQAITEGKYVIIVSNANILEHLDYGFNQIIHENKLFSLTSETQNDVLNFENVYIHGQLVRITDIADNEAAAVLIKNPQILEDILYRKLIIGKDLVKPDGFEEKFFDVEHLQYEEVNKNTQDVLNDGSKTVIISGQSGIGKSVYLYDLAEHMRASSDLLWIMQLNLNEGLLRQYLSDQDSNYVTCITAAIDLDKVCQKFFDMAINGKLKIKVVLFIDGYDELKEDGSITFIQRSLKQLQSSRVDKIYIASNSKTLETTLGISPYSLIFSRADKEQFLQKYQDFNPENIGNYVYRDFANTPLHLKMMVDLLKGNVDLRSLKNINRLYTEYVKFKLNDGNQLESAYRISVKKILKEEELVSLNADLNTDFNMPEDLLHHNFTQYFAVQWFLRASYGGDEAKYKVFKYMDRLVEHTSPIFIDIYIAPFALDSLIEELVQKGHLNFLKSVLNLKKTKKPCLRTVIESTHLNEFEILKYILELYNDTGDPEIMQDGELKNPEFKNSKIVKYVNQPVRGETPLETATRVGKFDLACELMLKGADTSNLATDFIDNLAVYVIDKTLEGNERYRHIVEKFLTLSSDAVQKLKNDNEYHKFLVYYFVYGRIQLIKMLLKDDPNRSTLLKTKICDKLLLDHVNESEQLSDSERCETVEYIIENTGYESPTRDEFDIGPVLASACKYEHTKTFKCVDYLYPGGCIGYLDQAIRTNECQTIRFLMTNMRDRTVDEKGNTALHRAVISDASSETVDFSQLIELSGIDVRNKAGKTALGLAFEEGADFHFIKKLVERKASLSIEDNTGLYPWCCSILATSRYSKKQQIKIMRYLIKKDIKAPERSGESFESKRKREEIVKKLEYFKNMDSYDGKKLAERLHEALKEPSEYNWCRFLIIHGADLSIKDNHGKTPLHIAVEYKRYNIAMAMLQFGAMFDVKDKNHMTPLRLLEEDTENRQEEYVKIHKLLKLANDLFSNTNKWDDYSTEFWNDVEESPLRYLINCRDSQGLTLFHVAALADTKGLVIKLNEFSKRCCQKYQFVPSLDVNAGDTDGETPLDIAATRKRSEVICQLFKVGASYESIRSKSAHSLISNAKQLFEAVKNGNVANIEELLKNECLTNASDRIGHPMIKSDLVDVRDRKGRTPLHFAVKNNQLECAILLLKHGASYDLRDHRGFTPFAQKRYSNETATILKMIDKLFKDIQSDNPQIHSLNDSGVLTNYLSTFGRYGIAIDIIVNVRDSKKNTLLRYAKRFNSLSVEINLIEHGALADTENSQVD